jgi:hypothetical protein
MKTMQERVEDGARAGQSDEVAKLRAMADACGDAGKPAAEPTLSEAELCAQVSARRDVAGVGLMTSEPVELCGDKPGHEFHGNQHTAGGGSAAPSESRAGRGGTQIKVGDRVKNSWGEHGTVVKFDDSNPHVMTNTVVKMESDGHDHKAGEHVYHGASDLKSQEPGELRRVAEGAKTMADHMTAAEHHRGEAEEARQHGDFAAMKNHVAAAQAHEKAGSERLKAADEGRDYDESHKALSEGARRASRLTHDYDRGTHAAEARKHDEAALQHGESANKALTNASRDAHIAARDAHRAASDARTNVLHFGHTSTGANKASEAAEKASRLAHATEGN